MKHLHKASKLLTRASLYNDLEQAESKAESLRKQLAEAEADIERIKREIEKSDAGDNDEEVAARLSYRRIYAKQNGSMVQ